MHRRLSIAGWLLAMTLPSVAVGQVVRDDSLGDPGPVLGGTDVNGEPATYLIDPSYEPQGGNLYHSFSEFSIQEGETATFEGPDSVKNVFSRVTGDPITGNIDVSEIFGVLRSTIPAANLFFFNRAGIAFGPEAKLDVQGSFHASTANEVRFEDGSVFGTLPDGTPSDPSLLSWTEPRAFGFTSGDPAPITVTGILVGQGEFLTTLDPGMTLSFVGGDVTIAGRPPFTTVRIDSGTLQIASVAGPTEVPLDVSTFAVRDMDPQDLGTVLITDGTFINLDGSQALESPGGRVVIRGGELVVDVSEISSGNRSPDPAPSYAIDVQVAGLVDVTGGSIIRTTSFFADGRGGDIRFEAGDMTVRNRAVIKAESVQGSTPASLRGDGDGGDIEIEVDGELRIESGGQVFTASGSPFFRQGGVGGRVDVQASTVAISAPDVRDPETSVAATTFGAGAAGSVEIDADSVHVSGPRASIFSKAGGAISIFADRLRVDGGAQVTVSTIGARDAGLLRVEANDVVLDGVAPNGQPSALLSQSLNFAQGAAGRIELAVADTLKITNGAQISVSSSTQFSGPSGDIDIRTKRLEMSNSPDGIRAESQSEDFDAGGITIVATDEVKVQDSSISTRAFRTSGGEIEISADNLIRLRRRTFEPDEPLVTAEVALNSAGEDGGSVTLEAETIVVDTAGVRANSPGGVGGNIEIVAEGFLVSGGDLREHLDEAGMGTGFFFSGGEVFAVDSGAGAGPTAARFASTGAYFDVSGALDTGTFVVRSPDAAVVANLASLSQKFLDVTKLQTNECAARSAPVGSLVVAGRDRVPAAPEDRVRALYLVEM